MLIDFSFSNYRSFRDEQSFSMSRDTRFDEGAFDGRSTITAVYGANASGKSNFLGALWTMSTMVRTSYSQGDATTGIPRDPFLLRQDARKEPSEFFVSFIAEDNQQYQYWFLFDDINVIHEELTVRKLIDGRLSSHASKLFIRDGNEIDFGVSFRGPKAQVKKTIELRPNALVLSAAAAAGIASIQSAFDFLASRINYYNAAGFQAEEPLILGEFARKTDFSKHLEELIRYADFGISTVRSAPVNIDRNVLEAFTQQLSEQLNADPEKVGQLLTGEQSTELRFEHAGTDMTATFGIANESRGTIAALSFFSLALRQLSRSSVTLIDEIDTSLHPTLVEELIGLFTDHKTNPHHAQLIFTTHDASLITASGATNRSIDPDQIWLVEKSVDGSSEIYPVTDLKVRRDENIGKNYLNGVYGAVPKPSFHTLFASIMQESGMDS